MQNGGSMKDSSMQNTGAVIRKRIIFYGRVQGVGFRYYSVHKARQLGLAGWVKNLDDGTVEMEVQGREAEIDHLLTFLDGHLWIRIDAMDVTRMEVIADNDFVER